MADARFFTLSSSFQTPFLSQKPILFPSKHGCCSTFKIIGSPRTSSSSSQHVVSRDFDIVSTKEKPDGSLVFQFGEASEISENVEPGPKPTIGPKTGELEIIDEELVTCQIEEVYPQNELVVDLSTKDRTLSEDEDVKSSAGNNFPGMINFEVESPVNKSELEDVVKDRSSGTGSNVNFTTSAVSPGLGIVSSKDVSQVEGKNEVASELTEFDIEVHASFASQAGKKESIDVEDVDKDEGGKDVNKVLASNSLETEILNEKPTNMAVDKEPSKAPTLYEELIEDTLDKKLVHGALDEEPAAKPTHQIMDVESVEQQTYHLVDVEPNDQPMVEEVAEQPTPTAANAEAVRDEGIESMNMKPTGALVEEPVEQQTQTEVTEELNHHELDEKLAYNQGVQSLELLDEKLPSSSWAEEIAEGDSQSSSDGDVSIPLAAGLQLSEATMTMEETSTPRNVLFSGAASLPHPSKALTGAEDAYFVHENWLGVADGIGQWSLEGTSAGLYGQELMKNCGKLADNNSNPITEPVEVLNKASMETLSPGSSTALVANFDGQVLRVANIGDSGFIIVRNGAVFKKSSPMVHEFNFPVQIEKGDNPSELVEEYDIPLDEGDIIITGTDGLFDNLYDQQIASIVFSSLQAGIQLQEIAELVAERAQELGQSKSVRSPFADEAQAAGYVGYNGGKLDHVTVIVSLVHQTSTHLQ
ncbi:probable protein phosphatase 2C 71 isoform X2 [Euphorbia lathyris]|uniref:probable protein phosphatase 2C 71 isoform X2 n=1 Tax=Euphorbia lathyris TaxID=212925 RepID=UPI0033133C2D